MIRPPAVSGRFYPSDPTELRATVATLLADARRAAGPRPTAPFRAVIVPHAGYVYSGPTAAAVFARSTIPGLVVILAPNHTGVSEAEFGVSLWEAGAFHTPLGDVEIDADAAAALLEISHELVAVDHAAHRGEHAVEVELPFLQMLRSDVRILPLVIAWDAWEAAHALGELLVQFVQAVGEPVLMLASSDLNHYEPAAVSERKDARALEAVTALDGGEVLERCKREHISMCGRGPVAVVLHSARALGATRADVVDYRHSGWVSGDNARVVGYAGVVIP
ncbi:MAG: AmmeMemoRadiSam system protein B [Acidobacteria bacterium 13_1_40CM_3_65_5]|nr:MAG: AmmeMemoRadiSam system protein B [Gemmatimonadetes bacterium 13_1_40CM_66_11]OLD21070.1 MAG: AmmeMemoRadiSam system protein B [Acidobacteria bacterium 13_1_40CM_3_65_5]